MFYLLDQPSKKEFQDLAQRYREMDPSSVKAMVTLLRVGSDLLTGFETLLRRYGLSQGRFLILIVMNREPDKLTRPSILAEQIGVTRATITGLINGLVRDGLIQRIPHGDDRRKMNLQLTRKGKDVLENLLPDYWSRIHHLMNELTENEQMTLTRLLEKVAKGIPELTKA